MPANNFHIRRYAFLHITGVALCHVLELGPSVHGVVAHVHIGLGGGQLVGVFVQPQHVVGCAFRSAGGVCAAGDGTGRAGQDVFALQLVNRKDVDAGQEGGSLHDLVLEQLLYAGRDGKLFADFGHAIACGKAGAENIEKFAGLVAHCGGS